MSTCLAQAKAIYLKTQEQRIPPALGNIKLVANATKWERTTLTPLKDINDKPEWGKTKKLGSLLGDEDDIERRMILATASFKSLRRLWERRKVTRPSTRMRAYNALVLPVLLYNCGTWGVTDAIMKDIEVFHRRQLREVLGVRTRDISTRELYKRCDTTPLRGRITAARWSLFGHVLRLGRDTPAQLAMDYYTQQNTGKASLGRAKITLPVKLFNEYEKYREDQKAKGVKGLKGSKVIAKRVDELRGLAADRQKWRELVIDVCDLDAARCKVFN